MKIKKVITMGLVGCILLSCVQANAKKLEDCFSGGSDYEYVSYSTKTSTYKYKKTTFAKTKGYDEWHYVRAYIGGSNDDATGAEADSGRKWKSGDVKATASVTKSIPEYSVLGYKLFFSKGYSKYGK